MCRQTPWLFIQQKAFYENVTRESKNTITTFQKSHKKAIFSHNPSSG